MTQQRTPGRARRGRLLAATSVLAVLLAGCGGGSDGGPGGDGAAGESKDPIKVGVIANLTGPFALLGANIQRNVELAADEINAAGGVDGRRVQVIVEDIQMDVAVTVDKARKLVERDDVDVVIGPVGSDANDAAVKVVAQGGGKILIYPEVYEGGKCDPLFFSTGIVPTQQLEPLIPAMSQAYGSKALLFGADYVWPHRSFEVAKPLIERAGGQVVKEVYLPLVADDFSELISAVRQTKPDYLLVAYPAAWAGAAKALADAGLLTDDLGVGTLFLGEEMLPGLGKLAANSYTTLPFVTVGPGESFTKYVEAFRAKHGADVIPGSGESIGSYAGLHLYAQAVKAAGSTDPKKVAKAMVGQSFDGPSGTVTITDSHHLKQPVHLVQATADGKYKHVRGFPEVDPQQKTCPS